MTRTRACDCGNLATSHRNIGGVLVARCTACAWVAEAQARADVAAAVAGGATGWIDAQAVIALAEAVRREREAQS